MVVGQSDRRRAVSRTRGGAAIAGALALMLMSACGGDRAGTTAAVASDQTSTAPTVTSVAVDAIQTRAPMTLPVTPVSVTYEIIDPAFDPLPGARAIHGINAGAGYRIEVPANWNGDVVYFAHGFRGNVPQLTIDAPPIREHLLDLGYAWAASSYSANGYEPGVSARDTLALRDVVARELGTPGREYIYGQSMGGHVVSLSLEQYPDAYDGALSECGVVSGHEILDFFLSWGAVSGYLTETNLYEVTADPEAFGVRIRDEVVPALGTLDAPTLAGQRFQSIMEHLSGGPRPFFKEGLAGNYEFNFVILMNAVAAAGPANAASQNVGTQYAIGDGLGLTADEINREIARIAANPAFRDARTRPEFAKMSGEISAPLLTLHNTGDMFVPISLEQSYRRIVDGAGAGDMLVQRAIRRAGHCNFTEAERERAFDDLVAWTEDGAQPAGDDLLGDLRQTGRAFTSPLEADDPGGQSFR